MKTTVLAATLGLAVLAPLSASAEHNSTKPREWAEPREPAEPRPWSAPREAAESPREPGIFGDLDLGLRIGKDGFSLSGRVFRPEGVFGAWLNGRLRRDGFSLDGQVQEKDRARNFRLNLDLWEGQKP